MVNKTITNDDKSQEPNITGPYIGILAQYIKDFSFENPDYFKITRIQEQETNVSIQMDVNQRKLEETVYEVDLTVNIKTQKKDQTMFLCEVKYAGLFRLFNIPEENLELVLYAECPRMLFPFVRRIISDIISDGGFPPLFLEPINFLEMYEKKKKEMTKIN